MAKKAVKKTTKAPAKKAVAKPLAKAKASQPRVSVKEVAPPQKLTMAVQKHAPILQARGLMKKYGTVKFWA